MRAVLPAPARRLLEGHLPPDLAVHWFATADDALAGIADADIAWVDLPDPRATAAVVAAGRQLRWVSTIYAGVDSFDLARLAERGTILTNGRGINAVAVAEYAVLGMLAAAKRFDAVVRLADQRTWTTTAPGTLELAGTAALVVGYGTIGRAIGDRLRGFDVAVTGVTASGRDGTLRPHEWRDRIGDHDWVVLAAPSTGDTAAMIGPAELAAMRATAWLVNVARGGMVDTPALIDTLSRGGIAGAVLDTVSPEPLPPDHPLWQAPNTIHTLHLSGRSQRTMYPRAAALFRDNLAAFLGRRPMRNVVDLDTGY